MRVGLFASFGLGSWSAVGSAGLWPSKSSCYSLPTDWAVSIYSTGTIDYNSLVGLIIKSL